MNAIKTAPEHAYDPLWRGDVRKSKRSKLSNAAILLSIAAHAGVIYYVYETKFTPHYKEYRGDPIEAQLLQLPKPPPPPLEQPEPKPVEKASPPPELKMRPPPLLPPTGIGPVEPIPYEPPPEPPPITPPEVKPVEPPAVRTIVSPNWSARPDAEDMARYYPERAQRLGVSGRAVIQCQVTAKGALAGCSVLSEDPSEFQFGEAALKLSRLFKMKPGMQDGQAVEGAVVKIPIAFRLPE